MTLSQIRSQIYALKRKLARPLAQLALQRMSEELALEWGRAEVDRQPMPDPHPFVLRVVDAGFRLPTFTQVMRYLYRCREEARAPPPEDLLRALLPWATPYPTIA